MTSERKERIFMGFFIPPILAGFLCAFIIILYKLMSSNFNFSWMRLYEAFETILLLVPLSIFLMILALVFYGVQCLFYSLLMEFVVQKINNDKLVILISILLGVFVVRVLGLGSISDIKIDPELANIVVWVGAGVGLVVGYYLRNKFKSETSQKLIQKDK